LSAAQEDVSSTVTLLKNKRIKVVVINRDPGFSPKLDPLLMASLKESFPEATDVGKFTVRWAN